MFSSGPVWRWKRGFLITMSFATTGSIVLTDGTSQWLVDDVHCTCNVNLRNFLAPTKATSGRSAYSSALYQIKSTIAKLLVSLSGQNPGRSSRGHRVGLQL